MTDFNSQPLAEQLKALQAGDELHLRGGGWLPFVEYEANPCEAIQSHGFGWYADGTYWNDGKRSTKDILRVHRPTERKVPEVVGMLREKIAETVVVKDNDVAITHILAALAYIAVHFEKETP